MVELEINPVPVVVRLLAALPAMAEVGLILVSIGAGFCVGVVLPVEEPPPHPSPKQTENDARTNR
jgi:hypothetical protein